MASGLDHELFVLQTPGQTFRNSRLSRASLERVLSRPDKNDSQPVTANVQPNEAPPTLPTAKNSNLQVVLTILQPSLINFLSSFTTGAITVGLPVIARSIDLDRSLYLWPSSVFGLTAGSVLLIAGSIADILGPRGVELVGCFLLGIFTLACGLSNTGIQLVVFRALQGVGLAIHLPSSVAIVASTVPQGKPRNIGFACLGLSQPFGFSVGLVVSGIMIERVGWRLGFFLSGGATLSATLGAFWILPKVKAEIDEHERQGWVKLLYNRIDWTGGLIASGGLAILAYVLAMLSADLSSITSATTASLLALSLVLILAFPFWMQHQERQGKPALVPNSLWKNLPFTSTCIMVALSYGGVNAMELFSSLYFQEIQETNTLGASLKLLPSLVVGVIINLSVGVVVDKFPARWLVTISSALCAGAPLMMALVDPSWNYWYMQFWAQVLTPMSVDVLFTVGLIVVSDVFPETSQALAGAVFSTVGQFGTSLGVGLCQLVALGVAGNEGHTGHGNVDSVTDDDPTALLRGYQASFWTMFAFMVVCTLLAVVGLRKAGTVGTKRE